MYFDYLESSGLASFIKRDYGFAIYHLRGQECYIETVFIKPEFRRSRKCFELGTAIENIARENKCKYVTGSVNTSIKDPTTSMKMLLAFGFKFLRSEPAIVWFFKEL